MLLTGLALTPVAAWALHRAGTRRPAGRDVFSLAAAAAGPGRRRWAECLWLVAFILLTIGAAGPRGGRDPDLPPSLGRDLVVALDVSRSMLARDDRSLSRLDRARAQLRTLASAVASEGGYRLALVVFAGRARILCPLTSDMEFFLQALEQAGPDLLGSAGRVAFRDDGESYGSSLQAALAGALAAQDPLARGFQSLLLVSDGEDQAGGWEDAAQQAAALGVAVHTLGLGGPAKPSEIPLTRNQVVTQKDASGKVRPVLTRRNDMSLDQIARLTAGLALKEETSADLGRWFALEIAPLPQREWAEDPRNLARSYYGWFFLGSLVLLVIEWLLR